MQENAFIDWLRSHSSHGTALRVGIGDDCAVMAPHGGETVVCTDLICDGVHFRMHECQPQQIGYKALAVNLSDMAAMAARPVAAFVSLLLPQAIPESQVHDIMRGMSNLASRFGVSIAGGDTNVWQGALALNVAVVGHASPGRSWLRSGALPEDVLLVTGTLGGSIDGRHLEFVPRVEEACLLRDRYDIHAAIDLSDGLAMDLARLTTASSGGAEVQVDRIPISVCVTQRNSDRHARLQHALGDGEDFELLLATSRSEADRLLKDQPCDVPITEIGRCTAAPELWLMDGEQRLPWPRLGYEHGFS